MRNNGTIQLQFFHRCSVVATGSKFVNGLLCFWRITFRLTKSIRIVRCFRSLSCLFYFRNFLYFAQSRGSFDTIAFLLAASRSRMPFFNSELIQARCFFSFQLVLFGVEHESLQHPKISFSSQPTKHQDHQRQKRTDILRDRYPSGAPDQSW